MGCGLQLRERGTRTRLTFGSSSDQAPLWTPDGAAVVYQSGDAIRRVPAVGGEPR